MNAQLIINKVNLLRAHAMEALKIADELTIEAGRDSKPKKRKEKPYDQMIANMLARETRKTANYTIKKATASTMAIN